MLSFLLVLGTLALFSLIVAVVAKRREARAVQDEIAGDD